MELLPLNVPRYPMLRFVARYGRTLALMIGILVVVAGVAMMLQASSSAAGAVVVLLGIAVLVIGRVVVEMVELITDMLLPK